MGIKKLTGRKPGHNASPNGFVSSPPAKPANPTSIPLFRPINRQDRLQNNNEKNSPPKPPEWDHIQKYGVSCNPKRYFGQNIADRTAHYCICGKEWTKNSGDWAVVENPNLISRDDHIQKYGHTCDPVEYLGKDHENHKTHSCRCGKLWVSRKIDGGKVEWRDIENNPVEPEPKKKKAKLWGISDGTFFTKN